VDGLVAGDAWVAWYRIGYARAGAGDTARGHEFLRRAEPAHRASRQQRCPEPPHCASTPLAQLYACRGDAHRTVEYLQYSISVAWVHEYPGSRLVQRWFRNVGGDPRYQRIMGERKADPDRQQETVQREGIHRRLGRLPLTQFRKRWGRQESTNEMRRATAGSILYIDPARNCVGGVFATFRSRSATPLAPSNRGARAWRPVPLHDRVELPSAAVTDQSSAGSRRGSSSPCIRPLGHRVDRGRRSIAPAAAPTPPARIIDADPRQLHLSRGRQKCV
jgi:hypothetical protein